MSDSLRAQVVRIVASVADGTLTVQDAANEVSATLATAELPADGSDTPVLEEFLWTFWNQILDTAEQQPHTQENLVSFIGELARPNRPQTVFRIWGHEIRLQDLALIGAASRERFNGVNNPSDPAAVEQWVALNAFFARLTATQGLFKLYAIWAMRAALEESVMSNASLQAANVRAAAVWIQFAGQCIHDLDEEFESGPTLGHPARGGEKWRGKEGFDPARWALWEAEFSKCAQDESLDVMARQAAEEASRLMRQFDGM